MFDLSQLPLEQRKQAEERLKKMTPEQIQELIKQQCVFCKIATHEIDAKVVYEDNNVMAILDVKPAVPGHILVLPKKHYSIFQQLPDTEVARIFSLAKYISTAIFDALGAQGTNIFVASGALAGQGAPHVLVHIIPRLEKDGLPQQWWQPKDLDEKKMSELQKKIGEKLKNVKTLSMEPAAEKPKSPESKATTPKKIPVIPSRIP